LQIIRIPVLFLLRAVKNITIVNAILDCTWEHWKQATLWAISSAVGSFMPIWGAFFLLRLHREPFQLVEFARHGELGLYAAAFLAPSVYLILKNMRKDKFPPFQGTSVFLALVGILMAAFIYAGTNPQLAASAAEKLEPIDEGYLLQMSGGLLLLALAFGFLVTLIDASVNDPDLGTADRVNQFFLGAAASADQPESVHGLADLDPPSEDAAISDDHLKQQFNADRTEGDENG
jgi:hypothetical protein